MGKLKDLIVGQINFGPSPKLTSAECKASLVAIHYDATRLYNMLPDKDITEKCIVHSIIKECEDRIPELKGVRHK
jgi:hypothetical protein